MWPMAPEWRQRHDSTCFRASTGTRPASASFRPGRQYLGAEGPASYPGDPASLAVERASANACPGRRAGGAPRSILRPARRCSVRWSLWSRPMAGDTRTRTGRSAGASARLRLHQRRVDAAGIPSARRGDTVPHGTRARSERTHRPGIAFLPGGAGTREQPAGVARRAQGRTREEEGRPKGANRPGSQTAGERHAATPEPGLPRRPARIAPRGKRRRHRLTPRPAHRLRAVVARPGRRLLAYAHGTAVP